jgi:hypothetical protein
MISSHNLAKKKKEEIRDRAYAWLREKLLESDFVKTKLIKRKEGFQAFEDLVNEIA